ncbi:MAG: transcriptional regulator [Rhodospirillales bacterium]
MSSETYLTGGQVRAARGFLRWSAEVLAERSRVGISTVKRAEAADGAAPITQANAEAIKRALELGGIEFVQENGGGAGVRLRKGTT